MLINVKVPWKKLPKSSKEFLLYHLVVRFPMYGIILFENNLIYLSQYRVLYVVLVVSEKKQPIWHSFGCIRLAGRRLYCPDPPSPLA